MKSNAQQLMSAASRIVLIGSGGLGKKAIEEIKKRTDIKNRKLEIVKRVLRKRPAIDWAGVKVFKKRGFIYRSRPRNLFYLMTEKQSLYQLLGAIELESKEAVKTVINDRINKRGQEK